MRKMSRKAIEEMIHNDYDWIWPPKKRKKIINTAISNVNRKSGKDKHTGSSYEKAIRWEISKISDEYHHYM